MTTTASGTGVPLDPRGYVAAARRLLTRPGSLADQEIRERAIGLLEPSLPLLPPGDHQRLEGQLMLATALIFGYECTGDAAPLQRAEHLLTSWGEQFTPGGFGRARYLAIVAWARLRQAEADGAEHLVAQAVRDARKGAREHPGDAELSAALGRALMLRYERTADRRALDQAVRAHTSATERNGDSDPLRASRLTALGSAIATKALLTGESAGIERAVNIQRQAVAAADPQDPGTAMVLHNLGTALLHYYELSGQPVLLEQALELHRRALQVTLPAHSHYPVCAEGLANALLFRFENHDDEDAAEQSARLRRATLAHLSEAHPMRARVQANLAGVLLRRAERSGDTQNLREAEDLIRAALRSTKRGAPARPLRLNALAVILGRRDQAEDAGEADDLQEACALLREAIEIAPDGFAYSAMFRSNLAAFLITRYEREHADNPHTAEAALNEAIGLHRHAVADTAPGHSERPRRVANLALALALKARHAQDARILDEAAAACRSALSALPEHDPGHGQGVSVAALIDRFRFEVTADRDAGRRALERYRRAAADEASPPVARVHAARDAGTLAVRLGEDQLAFESLRDAVHLLEWALSPSLGRGDQQRLLTELSALPRDAAALAIATGRTGEALAVLERGRGVLLGRRADARTAYDALAQREPQLAEQLRRIQLRLDRLEDPLEAPTGEHAPVPEPRSAADERAQLASESRELLARIRARPGLEGFLRPAAPDDPVAAASHGPIVVLNISEHRCDALALTAKGLDLIALPDVTADMVAEQAEKFLRATDSVEIQDANEVIEWTWETIAEPVLRALDLTTPADHGGPVPRLWWCPTGMAAFLPLHAAGRHNPEQGSMALSVLDLTAPSYTPSVRVLLRQRRQAASAANTAYYGMLLVAVDSSPLHPQAPALTGVQRDIEHARARFSDLTVLAGEDATVHRTLREMVGHPYVHFSCHGVQNLNAPFDGHLVLHDGVLTVDRIADQHLPDARLAFVSACETFRGGTRLPDEAISLAAALQLAGYPHVVATQWQVSESFTDTVAEAFYDAALRSDGGGNTPGIAEAAHALRNAVLRARASGASAFHWAPFIHTGP